MDIESVELSRQENRLNYLPAIWPNEEPAFPQRRLSDALLRLVRSSACSYLQFRPSPLPYHMPQRARAEHGVDRRA